MKKFIKTIMATALLPMMTIGCKAYSYEESGARNIEPQHQVVTMPIVDDVKLLSDLENGDSTIVVLESEKQVNHGTRETGLVIRPEIGLGLYSWPKRFFDWGGYLQEMYHQNNMWWEPLHHSFFHISVNAGYQFTPHIYLGGGGESIIGLLKPHYHSFPGIYGRDVAVSLYGNFRWYWFDGDSSPFLELNTGILSAVDIYHPDFNKKTGLILTPSFGWDIKNCDIIISCLIRNSFVYDNHSMSFMEEPSGSWLWDGGLRLTVGYNFMIKNKKKTKEKE